MELESLWWRHTTFQPEPIPSYSILVHAALLLLTTTGRLMTRPTNRSRQRLLPPAKLRLMTPSQRSCELWHPATTPQSSKVRTTLQESLCWKSITYREAGPNDKTQIN